MHRVHALGRGRYLLRTLPCGAAVSAAHGRRCCAPAWPASMPTPCWPGCWVLFPGWAPCTTGNLSRRWPTCSFSRCFVSLSDKSSFFGLLVAAWTFYQVFDAAQTAKARRDGLPLPNPFGLNDLGVRLGMTPAAPPYASRVFAYCGARGTTAARDPAPVKAQVKIRPAGVRSSRLLVRPTVLPHHRPVRLPRIGVFCPPLIPVRLGYRFVRLSGALLQGRSIRVGQSGPVSTEPQGHRHPVGAIVLIVIGLLLLLHTLGVFEEEWIGRAWPLIIIGVGAWLLYRRTHDTAAGRRLMNAWLLIRRLRGPAFLIMVGITALLNQWGVLSFGRSWPLYLILAGVLGLAERAALAAAPPPPPIPLPRPPADIPSCRPIPARNQRPLRLIRSPTQAGGRDGHPAPALLPARRGPGAALLPPLAPPSLHPRPVGADCCRGDRAAGGNQQAERRCTCGTGTCAGGPCC